MGVIVLFERLRPRPAQSRYYSGMFEMLKLSGQMSLSVSRRSSRPGAQTLVLSFVTFFSLFYRCDEILVCAPARKAAERYRQGPYDPKYLNSPYERFFHSDTLLYTILDF